VAYLINLSSRIGRGIERAGANRASPSARWGASLLGIVARYQGSRSITQFRSARPPWATTSCRSMMIATPRRSGSLAAFTLGSGVPDPELGILCVVCVRVAGVHQASFGEVDVEEGTRERSRMVASES
jgi:hypothetical protein